MKNLWKNVCACSLAVACGVGVAGCGDDNAWTSKDLDGDGVISSWETVFDSSSSSQVGSSAGVNIDASKMVNVTNAAQLLDINNRVEERLYYVLKNDIDLGGQEVSINLGNSVIYGQGHVIRNFTLGTPNIEGLYDEESFSAKQIKCLFYNGSGVYDLKIFAGVQSLNVDSGDARSYNSVSMFYNTSVLSGVMVKGKNVITSKQVDGRNYARVESSLLYAGMGKESVSETKEFDENVVTITNCSVDGEIVINDAVSSMVGAKVGLIASTISKNSSVYNVYAMGEIEGSVFADDSYVGGLVGHNLGFLSTGVYTGAINLDNAQGKLYSNEYIGGIVGCNDVYAEVKNCSTNATINLVGNEGATIQSRYTLGGLVGENRGGVIELGMTDAVINISGMKNITVGGFCGTNDRGILSYGICRGSVNLTNVDNITTAQVVGMTNQGYFEKVLTTTAINIDNSGISTSAVDAGLVAVFDEVDQAPFMYRVLADGTTSIFCREEDNSKIDYNHGLRNSFQVPSGEQDEESGEDIMIEMLPGIFKNVFVAESCRLKKYSLSHEQRVEDIVTTMYTTAIGDVSNTPRWLMDNMDFKNYLNHHEVNLGETLSFQSLSFTINDENVKKQSYFGYSRYNGELRYFDREFTEYFKHEESALGSCVNDSQDELLSFVYNLIEVNNGVREDNYVVKITDEFLNISEMDDTQLEGLSLGGYFLKERFSNVFTCLNTVPTLSKLDSSGVDITLDDTGTSVTKYLQYTFADSTYSYTMKIDISGLDQDAGENLFAGEYYLYITFAKDTGPTV